MGIIQTNANEVILQGKNLIQNSLELLGEKDYHNAMEKLIHAQKHFSQEQSPEGTSICLSLIGLVEYLQDKSKYVKALTFINDAKYLANYTKNPEAKAINELVLGDIEFSENNLPKALIHYENAKHQANLEDGLDIKTRIEDRLKQAREGKVFDLCEKRDPLIALLKIGQTVAAETNIDTLLKVIAEETKAAIQADRCSVFLYDKENNELWSKVALGMDSQEIRFPADRGLAGHVVKTGEPINIKDAYNDERFNKEIDLQTGYRTKTILCMPIKNLKQEIIGAFQVLNKFHGEFSEEDEDLLVAIGSSAGIALENAQLFKKQEAMIDEQKQIFDSFIDTLAASIDARDKITAGHSSRVKMYASLIAKELGLDDKMIEIIEKAASLHDIGKIGIRDSVLQKEGKLTDEEYKHIQEHVEITYKILNKIHSSEEFQLVTEIACSHHEKYNGFGYYRKLQGEQIHLGGRILAVSDVFDAITSKRHYRDKMPIANVIDILIKDSGSHFDKNIVDCFLNTSSDKVIKVFLTENHLDLTSQDQEILQQYSMRTLYDLLTGKQLEEYSEQERIFTDTFNKYYTSKSNKESAE